MSTHIDEMYNKEFILCNIFSCLVSKKVKLDLITLNLAKLR